jgi:hypothetical protein
LDPDFEAGYRIQGQNKKGKNGLFSIFFILITVIYRYVYWTLKLRKKFVFRSFVVDPDPHWIRIE